jgi:hypothetical protein
MSYYILLFTPVCWAFPNTLLCPIILVRTQYDPNVKKQYARIITRFYDWRYLGLSQPSSTFYSLHSTYRQHIGLLEYLSGGVLSIYDDYKEAREGSRLPSKDPLILTRSTAVLPLRNNLTCIALLECHPKDTAWNSFYQGQLSCLHWINSYLKPRGCGHITRLLLHERLLPRVTRTYGGYSLSVHVIFSRTAVFASEQLLFWALRCYGPWPWFNSLGTKCTLQHHCNAQASASMLLWPMHTSVSSTPFVLWTRVCAGNLLQDYITNDEDNQSSKKPLRSPTKYN